MKIRRYSKMKQWKNPQLINLSVNKTNENNLDVTNVELRHAVRPS